jgi:hypothetical protein
MNNISPLATLQAYLEFIRKEDFEIVLVPRADWENIAARLYAHSQIAMWVDKIVLLCAAVDAAKRATSQELN